MSNAGEDAILAARLCAIDPRLGGMVLRGDADACDAVIAALVAALPKSAPVRRLPVNADEEALAGGLDLGATLAAGRRVERAGLLAATRGGVLVVPMAERLEPALAARVAAAIDAGEAPLVLALVDAEDGVAPALVERLAFSFDLSLHPNEGRGPAAQVQQLDPGLRRGGDVAHASVEQLTAICAAAAALGVDTQRATQFILWAAIALASGAEINDDDVAIAARLVLGHRATRLPPETSEPTPPEQPEEQTSSSDPRPLDDVVLDAIRASLPKDLLDRLAVGNSRRTGHARGAGERRRSPRRGRPAGTRAGMPRGGLRLALIDTLRAAAPWQRARGADGARVRIRKDDLRIRRFKTRAEATTIVAVDASGSAAAARLAEAKGAVELLLGQAYVKRAQVALVAFRGSGAEVLLPPTRSLARARRCLADLPGGGGTPIAAGLSAARELAEDAARRGRTPFLVVLTDGRANVGTDPQAEAEAAARAIGAAGIAAALVDISARPRAEGARLAAAMRARYLPLPRADAHAMHAAIAAVQP